MSYTTAVSCLGAMVLFAGLCGGAKASDFASCAKVNGDAQRLACYDLLAKESLFLDVPESSADTGDEAAERKRIVSRCREEMGEYGSAMVKACADQDIEAYRALASYSAELRPFIDRCKKEMGRYGWSMVRACADQDIDAERALNDLIAN